MTPSEAAQLLMMASALDGRAVSDETATAWAWALSDVDLETGKQALREHITGPNRDRFFTHTHIRDYLDAQKVKQAAEMKGMVMTARGLGLVTGYPDTLSDEDVAKVQAWRDKNAHLGNTEAITPGTPGKAIEVGNNIGKDMP